MTQKVHVFNNQTSIAKPKLSEFPRRKMKLHANFKNKSEMLYVCTLHVYVYSVHENVYVHGCICVGVSMWVSTCASSVPVLVDIGWCGNSSLMVLPSTLFSGAESLIQILNLLTAVGPSCGTFFRDCQLHNNIVKSSY